MQKVSISPSMLESYRNLLAGNFIYTGDELEAEIVGPRVASDAMSRGTALHMMIENGPRQYADQSAKLLKVYEKELDKTWEFPYEVETAIKSLLDKNIGMAHEVKDLIEFDISGVKVFMSLRVDGLLLDCVKEFKTKGSAPSYMGYFDSVQWKCYLTAFPDCERVEYSVFHLGSRNNLLGFYEYEMRRYAGLEKDVELLLSGFIEWSKSRPKVWQHLQNRADGYRVQ